MRKKPDKTPPLLPAPAAPDGPAYRMELSRDEVYRIVNATYHAHLELLKTNVVAIRHRGQAYGRIAVRMDEVFMALAEHGLDAKFDVQFFLKKENPTKE